MKFWGLNFFAGVGGVGGGVESWILLEFNCYDMCIVSLPSKFAQKPTEDRLWDKKLNQTGITYCLDILVKVFSDSYSTYKSLLIYKSIHFVSIASLSL